MIQNSKAVHFTLWQVSTKKNIKKGTSFLILRSEIMLDAEILDRLGGPTAYE